MVRQLLLVPCSIVVGLLAYFAVDACRAAIMVRRAALGWASAWAGLASGMFVITLAVFNAPAVPLTRDAVWFGLSMMFAAGGLIFAAFDERRQDRRREDT